MIKHKRLDDPKTHRYHHCRLHRVKHVSHFAVVIGRVEGLFAQFEPEFRLAGLEEANARRNFLVDFNLRHTWNSQNVNFLLECLRGHWVFFGEHDPGISRQSVVPIRAQVGAHLPRNVVETGGQLNQSICHWLGWLSRNARSLLRVELGKLKRLTLIVSFTFCPVTDTFTVNDSFA